MSQILHSDFKYVNASDSAKPNYLKNKFDRIRREQRETTAKQKAETEAISIEQAVKIRVLKGAAK